MTVTLAALGAFTAGLVVGGALFWVGARTRCPCAEPWPWEYYEPGGR